MTTSSRTAVHAVEPVLVIGGGGMLGRAFVTLLAREGIGFRSLDLPQIDITDSESVNRALGEGTRTVINCAAYTAVDEAETQGAVASAVNGQGVGLLAARCSALRATLVHYSSDYVFSGRAGAPYPIDHPIEPINEYGRSKAVGEELLRRAGCEHLLIRTSWLYAPWGKNFVLTMAELTRARDSVNVVNDQLGRPTSAEYLAERSLGLLRAGERGVFHVADGGQCSWFELARFIARHTGAQCRVDPVTTDAFPRPARRPAYSVLDLSRVESVLGPSRPWEVNVARALDAARASSRPTEPG